MFQKNNVPKFCALLLALMMLIGCTQTSTTPAASSVTPVVSASIDVAATPAPEAPKEIVTYTAFQNSALDSSVAPWDTPVGKAISELTGVRLEVEYLVGTDARQKASTVIAGGTYPDLLFPGEATGDFVAAGAFIPLDDYVAQFGDNIKKYYREGELKLIKAQYDATYYIPGTRAGVDPLYPSAGYYLSIDLLKKANWPQPKTLDEWKNLVFDYCQANPTVNGQKVIGYTGPTDAWRMSALQYGGARFLAGYPNDGPSSVNQDTLEAKVIMTQDYYKEFLHMIWEFNQRGLLDPEMFMQTDDQFKAKLSTGSVAAFYEQRGNLADPINYLEKNQMFDSIWIAFPVTLPGVDKERYYGPIGITTQTGYGITTAAKDPEALFKFLDQCAGEEVSRLRQWGIVDVDYTVVDGVYTMTPEQWKNNMDDDYKKKQGIGRLNEFPRMEDTFDKTYAFYADGNPVAPSKTNEYLDIKYKDYEKEVLAAYNITRMGDFFNPPYQAKYEPGWAIRSKMPADMDGKIAVEQALEATSQAIPMIVLAKDQAAFDAKWDDLQKKLSGLKLAEFETEMNRMLKESAKFY